jgi:predicted ABC-type sugar transport system permease subunit
MKQIFAIICALFMLACMSIDDVVIAEASETTQCKGLDFDVGFHVTETSAATVAINTSCFPEFYAVSVPVACNESQAVPLSNHATTNADTATIFAPTITSAVTLRQQKQPDYFWRGGDTKASPCKAKA